MTEPNRQRKRGKKAGRGRRRTRSEPAPAARVLTEARAPAIEKPAEVPLTPAEIARMKSTFRFLRQHRNTLKLKVNAAEDLLLNGKREPTHRGQCKHLLSKLDRNRVLQAAERLAPEEATRLLAGVVRFAPEISYVVRFLQCVKASESQGETAAALTQALEQLDFDLASAAQMRDILALIVDVYPATELPVFAFTLLERAEFREAFDRSSAGLPDALAGLLTPLRALYVPVGSVAGKRGGGPRVALAARRRGALLMLEASLPSLRELSPSVRRRIFDCACDALGPESPAAAGATLVELSRSVEHRDDRERHQAGLDLAGALLRAGQEKRARSVLAELTERTAGGGSEEAGRWLHALDGQRVGHVCVLPRRARGRRGERSSAPRDKPSPLAADRWHEGWHVTGQSSVRVRVAAAGQRELLGEQAELWGQILVPGVVSVVEAVESSSGRVETPAHLVVESPGPSLARRLQQGRMEPRLALTWGGELCRMLASLAAAGLELPDASLQRFALDDRGRLWLRDVWGVRRQSAEAAQVAHLALAQAAVVELLESLPLVVSPGESELAEAADLAAACALLCREIHSRR